MSTLASRPRSRSSRLLAIATSLLVALSGLFVVPTVAHAAEGDVTGATLDWGFKESWRGYVAGTIGGPNSNPSPTVLAGGVSDSPAAYRWGTAGTGTFSEATQSGSFSANPAGSITWNRNHGPAQQIGVTLADLVVSFDLNAGTGTITGTYSDPIRGITPTTAVMAVFSTAGATVSDGVVSLVNATATAGPGIAGFTYNEGDAMDAVSFSFAYEQAQAPIAQATATSWSSVPAAPVTEGTAVTLEATVTPAAAGTVTFLEGSTVLGSGPVDTVTGKASAGISGLAVGPHSIIASFAPTDTAAYLPSQTAEAATVTVNAQAPVGPTQTTLVLTGSANSVSDGHQVGLTATLTPAAASGTMGTIQFYADGAAIGAPVNATVQQGRVAVSKASDLISDGDEIDFTAVFTPANANAYTAATSNTVTVTGTASTGTWTPEIEVFLKTGGAETPYTGQKVYRGDELVVRGSGFDPEANVGGRGLPVPFGPQGTYVVFGNFDSTGWQPSENAASTKRKVKNQGWVLAESVLDTVPAMYKSAILNQWVEPEDGVFEWSSGPLETPDTVANGAFGIYTYAAGGALNAAEELEVLIDYVDAPRPGSPALEVFLKNGDTEVPYTNQEVREGDQLVVRGTGFDPYANVPANTTGGVPIPNSLPQGAFAVFGHFAAEWRPSEGVPSTQRKIDNSARTWLLAEDTLEAIPNNAPTYFQNVIRGQWTELDPETGSFEWTVTLKAPAEPLENGNYGIYTYAGGAGQVTNAAQELYVPINFTTEPENPGGGEEEPATGGLIWSFKSSWNFYLNNIANGTTTVSNGATQGANGQIGYVQVEGGDYDADTGLGTIRYQGLVRYVSTQHGFDIVLSDPWVVFGEDGATITANVSRTDTSGVSDLVRITVASIDAGAPAAADGALAWTDIEGVFSPDIQPDGWSQYGGEAIDPVTFTYGADGDGTAETGPTVTISSFTVKQGGEITFTGAGFEPGTAVTATVHSDPVVLGTRTADANGAVSFAWTVPADFEATEHTIELTWGDGESVSTTFLVQAATVSGGTGGNTPSNVCVARAVTGGSLEWGLKESFRSYVQGPIANGTFSGGSFAASGGAFNVVDGGIGRANFSGAISASGHGGLLNFQLSSPSVQITGPGTGVLFAHVSSTSTTGAAAVNGVVAFANLSFSGPAISGSTLSVSGASATLTGAGAQAFAGFYPAGTALDPVSFSVSLGGEVPCDSTTDPVELAKTGANGDMSVALLSIAALAVLLGFGAMRLRRRREELV